MAHSIIDGAGRAAYHEGIAGLRLGKSKPFWALALLFLALWLWSTTRVTSTWQANFRQEMAVAVQAEHRRQRAERSGRRGRPNATVVTGCLLLDDSVHCKPKGRKMAGLGRHYLATEKKVVNGHCLFTGLYVLLGRRCPLEPRLYRQKAVYEREGISFQSKVDLAAAEIEAFEPMPNTHTRVLVNSWYHCRRVRRAADRRGWDISGGLKSNCLMRISTSEGGQEWVRLNNYVASLDNADRVEVTWPSHEGGTRCTSTLCRPRRASSGLHWCWTRESLDQPLAPAR